MKPFSETLLLLGLTVTLFHAALSEEDYQKKATELHNQYRSKHGASALASNDDLNSRAVQCAKYYHTKGVFDMSCPYKQSAGENLYAIGGGGITTPDALTKRAIDNWYSKAVNYDYSSNEFQMKAGQFTQLVWKGTNELGFGTVLGNNMGVAVGLYTPAGNVLGRFKNDVQQPL